MLFVFDIIGYGNSNNQQAELKSFMTTSEVYNVYA